MTSIKYDHFQAMATISGKSHQDPLKTVGVVAAETRLCLRTEGRTQNYSPLRLTSGGKKWRGERLYNVYPCSEITTQNVFDNVSQVTKSSSSVMVPKCCMLTCTPAYGLDQNSSCPCCFMPCFDL